MFFVLRICFVYKLTVQRSEDRSVWPWGYQAGGAEGPFFGGVLLFPSCQVLFCVSGCGRSEDYMYVLYTSVLSVDISCGRGRGVRHREGEPCAPMYAKGSSMCDPGSFECACSPTHVDRCMSSLPAVRVLDFASRVRLTEYCSTLKRKSCAPGAYARRRKIHEHFINEMIPHDLSLPLPRIKYHV